MSEINVEKYDKDVEIFEGNYLMEINNKYFDRHYAIKNNLEWNPKKVLGYAKTTSKVGDKFVILQKFMDY